MTVRATSARGLPTVAVEWTGNADEHTVADLGDTVEGINVYRAIRDHAPATTEVSVVPTRSFGLE